LISRTIVRWAHHVVTCWEGPLITNDLTSSDLTLDILKLSLLLLLMLLQVNVFEKARVIRGLIDIRCHWKRQIRSPRL